jgi:type IV fimbrial biogenesis protein FimT
MTYIARGFTFLEMLIAIAVAAVLLAVAIPAWSSARAKVHSTNVRAAMTITLNDSLRHATVAGAEVVVCPTLGTAACVKGTDWSHGWIAFADLDGDRIRSARETLLHREPKLEGGIKLRSTPGRTRLVFQPNGSNAGSNVTFTLCDDRGPRHAITLVLANNGRLRAGKPTSAAASQCAYG